MSNKNNKNGNYNPKKNYNGPKTWNVHPKIDGVMLRPPPYSNLIEFEKHNGPKVGEKYPMCARLFDAYTEAEAYETIKSPSRPARDTKCDNEKDPLYHQARATYELNCKIYIIEETEARRLKRELQEQKVKTYNFLKSLISQESWQLLPNWDQWHTKPAKAAANAQQQANNAQQTSSQSNNTQQSTSQSNNTQQSTSQSSTSRSNNTQQSTSQSNNSQANTLGSSAATALNNNNIGTTTAPLAPAGTANILIRGKSVDDEKDPYKLIQAIRATHFNSPSGSSALDISEAWNDYFTLKQNPNDSLLVFYRKFQQKLDTLVCLNQPIPAAEIQGAQFINALDDGKFKHLKEHFVQAVEVGQANYPATLDDAYQVANKYITNNAKNKPKQNTNVVAYNTKATPKKESKPKKDIKPRNPYCHVCNNGEHWTSECPAVVKAKKGVDEEKGQKQINLTETHKKVEKGAWHTTVTVLHSHKIHKDGKNNREIILDNAANAGVCANPSLLTNIRTVDHSAEIKGYGGHSVTTNVMGDYVNGLGPAYLSEEGGVNLVAFGRLESMYTMNYEPCKRFHFTNDQGEEISFIKSQVDNDGNGFYIYNAPESLSVLLNTVEENKTKLSAKELEGATKAREFMRRTGFLNENEAIRAIRNGSILDVPITIQDIINKVKVWGKELANIKGKTTERRAKEIKDVPLPLDTTINRIQHLGADIMWVDGLPFLLTVAEQLKLSMVRNLNKDKSAANITKAILDINSIYRSRGFVIGSIESDREGGVMASKARLAMAGINLNEAGAGKHVPLPERYIQTFKGKLRAIISTLPFRIPEKLIPYLVEWVAHLINAFPPPSSNDNIAPLEHFNGRKLNYERDFKFAFGDYVQAKIPKNSRYNDVRQPRTEAAIVLGMVGNRAGSFRCMILSTGKIVVRNHGIKCPMPVEVVEALNAMQARDPIRGKDDLQVNVNDFPLYGDIDEEPEGVDEIAQHAPVPVEPLAPNDEGFVADEEEDQVIQFIPEDAPDDYTVYDSIPADELDASEDEDDTLPPANTQSAEISPSSIIDSSRHDIPDAFYARTLNNESSMVLELQSSEHCRTTKTLLSAPSSRR